MWILPTLHDSYENFDFRKKFIKSLRNIARNYDNTVVLPLRQVWSRDDESLYDSRRQRLTSSGYDIIWSAIDRTIRYADLRITRYMFKPLIELFPNQLDEEDNIVRRPQDVTVTVPGLRRLDNNNDRNTSSNHTGHPTTARRSLSYDF